MGITTASGCTPIVASQPCCMHIQDVHVANLFLVQSVIDGDLSGVTRALAAGADVDTTVEMSADPGATDAKQVQHVTPVMHAAALGHKDIVRNLVDASASLLRRDSRGWPPLCYALASCELHLAKQILSLAGSKDQGTETLYLPELRVGTQWRRLLVRTAVDGEFRVQLPPKQAGLQYRRSARWDDGSFRFAERGSVVRGVLCDGWLKVELEPESLLEVAQRLRDDVAAECEAKRGPEAAARLRKELYLHSGPCSARTACRVMAGSAPMFVP